METDENYPYGINSYDNLEQDDVKPRRLLSRVGFALFFMAVLILGTQIIINKLITAYLPSISNTDWYLWAVTAITVIGVGLPVFYIITKHIPDSKHGEVRKLSLFQFIVIFFISLAAMYLTNYIGTLISFLISLIKGEAMTNPLLDVVTNSNMLVTILYGSIAAPIVEETIFRKLMLNKLRRLGDMQAILLTGFAFGLFHMNLSQFFYATALGIIFAYIAIKTNTIRYTILLHMIINFIGTAIAPLVIKRNFIIIEIFALWVITAIAVGIICFILNVKKIKLEKGSVQVYPKSIYICNFGTILFTILCLYMMVQATLA